MHPRIDTCEIKVQYPYRLERELDEALPLEQIPPPYRWLEFNFPWEQFLGLWRDLSRRAREMTERVVGPAEVVSDVVEQGLQPAAELARREFPERMEEFCSEIQNEAFRNAPFTSRRLVAMQFCGPLWACGGAVEVAAREVTVVALQIAGRYWAVASRDPSVSVGAHLDIRWSTPAVREFHPRPEDPPEGASG